MIGSLIGVAVYFIPFFWMGTRSIFIDHVVTTITFYALGFAEVVTLLLIVIGGGHPFYAKSWNKGFSSCILSVLKVAGGFLGVMAFFQMGPDWLLGEEMLPLLFYSIAMPVALLIPIGSVFLTFLVDYGLLSFLGVFLKPVMRPVWKVPGIAAVNIVASFVGSFSVGIFMTDQLYREGRYTMKEAAIVLTGFSTVSTAFMVIIAKNLALMHIWHLFFGTTLIITFAVTAITARIYPLRNIPSTYVHQEKEERKHQEDEENQGLLLSAFSLALKEAESNRYLFENIKYNLKEGVRMSLRFLPLILSIGMIVFILARKTLFFDGMAYVLYPFLDWLRIPEPMLVAKAISTAGAEVLMPSLILATVDVPVAARFVTGVVSISSVLFLSGTIPCIIGTSVPISMKNIFVILLERIILTLLILSPMLILLS